MSELVYREKCEHGRMQPHNVGTIADIVSPGCPGGFEWVLDPDKVLFEFENREGRVVHQLTVADVLAALDKETP